MPVDGNWDITVNSPMGAQKNQVTLASDGGTLTGTSAGNAGSQEIKEGTVNGDDVAWKIDITTPMPMTLEFTGKVEEDAIAGNVKAGAFGSFPFSGTRA